MDGKEKYLLPRWTRVSTGPGPFRFFLAWFLPATIGAAALMSACGQENETPKEKTATLTETQTDRWTRQRHLLVAALRSGRSRISSERVVAAMAKTPRHEFVPPKVRYLSYANRALPIGYGQTISQPSIVAFMTEQLEPEPEERVLEVGTGSGYQAAVLAHLVKEVYTIEIVEPLAVSAQQTLRRLGYENVHVKAGDGYRGWPEKAPFDAIIVTCAPSDIPKPLIEQLKEGGRLIIPVGPEAGSQELVVLEKEDGEVSQKAVLPVQFVPMTGEAREQK